MTNNTSFSLRSSNSIRDESTRVFEHPPPPVCRERMRNGLCRRGLKYGNQSDTSSVILVPVTWGNRNSSLERIRFRRNKYTSAEYFGRGWKKRNKRNILFAINACLPSGQRWYYGNKLTNSGLGNTREIFLSNWCANNKQYALQVDLRC